MVVDTAVIGITGRLIIIFTDLCAKQPLGSGVTPDGLRSAGLQLKKSTSGVTTLSYDQYRLGSHWQNQKSYTTSAVLFEHCAKPNMIVLHLKVCEYSL